MNQNNMSVYGFTVKGRELEINKYRIKHYRKLMRELDNNFVPNNHVYWRNIKDIHTNKQAQKERDGKKETKMIFKKTAICYKGINCLNHKQLGVFV